MIMKKFLAIVCMMLMSTTAMFAQGEMGLGLNLNYAVSDNYKPFGLGVKFQYEFAKNCRGEALSNYYFPKNDNSVGDLNLNFQYLVHIGDVVTFYPVAGLSLIDMMITGDTKKVMKALNADTSKFLVGFNAGVGFEFYLSQSWKANIEAKYQYAKSGDWKLDWEPLSIGVAYRF